MVHRSRIFGYRSDPDLWIYKSADIDTDPSPKSNYFLKHYMRRVEQVQDKCVQNSISFHHEMAVVATAMQ